MVFDFLKKNGAVDMLANKVQKICNWVSYSHEIANAGEIQNVLKEVPELAIVQDADRLDALGAVGIARCFSFGGMKGRSLEDSMKHCEEKLMRLEKMMKTDTGRAWAEKRTMRIEEFSSWWDTEIYQNDCCVP